MKSFKQALLIVAISSLLPHGIKADKCPLSALSQLGVAAAIVGACATGGYYWYCNSPESPEKKFERALETLKKIDNDQRIQDAMLVAMGGKDEVATVENWFPTTNQFPAVEAYYYLLSVQASLSFIANAMEEAYETYQKDDENLRVELYEKVYPYQEMVRILIGLLEESDRYAIEISEYCAQYAKINAAVQKPKVSNNVTPVVPYYSYQKPTVVAPPVIFAPAPQPTVKQVAAPSTISPVLNGDVYGTIWSNY